MDHGPILAQKKVDVEWPPYIDVLEPLLAHKGGELLSAVIPQWLAKQITPVTQAHEQATYCKKITKADGEIHLSDAPEHNLRKIRAFRGWPYAYFFTVRNNTRIRVLVTEAHIENDQLVITKVIPEGKKEMSFADFERGLSKSLK
jgi:methionyl-tRNA formyltransferase